MDVQKIVIHKEYKLFGKVFFEIVERTESNYNEDVTPFMPIVELNLNDTNNHN